MTGGGVLLVAHGTRHAAGARTARRLADGMAARLGAPAALAFADVRGPTVAEALDGMAGPVTVVPAFLASGYHVRVDIPEQVRSTGRTDVTVTPPLGSGPALLPALVDRLAEAGVRDGDVVVLAAAGTSSPEARAEVEGVAARLGRLVGGHGPAPVGWAATAEPRIEETVAELRASGARRVAVATWLLAPGLFADRVRSCGADVVADPLGAHPAVLRLLTERAHPPPGPTRPRPFSGEGQPGCGADAGHLGGGRVAV
ncbi:sirohydrochlorin chelatase [Streptomyces albiaxialis]|uniref:Sirohydrochlorin chelatase n=1 Tax=Streptomyces albiaxialis TaxID=329523 RepID=A0ABN2W1Z7_9ACTN